eukprot:TRINITY_DN140_c1_g2_i6.p1 TRINITY_DN140_c1_g2~~TRINITY_DN140_c1_g2_i6.p1  ORF type:complete len:232 (+),score=34.14 TRINITY_DN140_c1_g2_i6:113-808(+)
MGKLISKYLFFDSNKEPKSESEKNKSKRSKKDGRQELTRCVNSKVEELLADYEQENIQIPNFYTGKDRIFDLKKDFSSYDVDTNQAPSLETFETSIRVWDGKITMTDVIKNKQQGEEEEVVLPLNGKLKMSIFAFSKRSEEEWQKNNWPRELKVVEVLERNQLKPFYEEINSFKPKFGIELENTQSGVDFFEQSRRWSRGYILRANNNINQEVMLMFEYNYYPTLIILPPT